MKKVIKRFVCAILCVMMVVPFNKIAVKAQDTSADVYLVQKAYEFMNYALEDASAFGLNCSQEDFTLSQCVPAYMLNEGVISKNKEVEYYFILSGSNPVAEMAVASRVDDILPAIQFSTDLSNTYCEYGKDSFTIILGDEVPYFYSNLETDVQLVSSVIIEEQLLPSTYANIAEKASSYPASYGINLPIKSQGNYGLCWAASVASVGQKLTGINKSAKQVAKAMNIGYDEGGDSYTIADALKQIYGLSATVAGGVIQTGSVADILMSGGGIIAGFLTNDLVYAHAVAINGYNANSTGCYYTIMDPNSSSYVMITAGTDPNGFNTYWFNYSGYGIFYWYDSVYCF